MPEIEITAEQRDRLRALQEDLARDVVGKYGHVRPKDAVEYLLDRYDEDDAANAEAREADAAAADAVATADVPDSTAAGDDVSDVPANVDPNVDTDAGAADDPNVDTDAGGSNGGEAVARVVGDGADAGNATTPDATASGEGATESTGEGTETASESAAGDDSMLDAMLSLLDTHDDKWEESSAADERYAVELPDGSTEHVRTKDDVKALLFKHYR
ncbi:MAG: hypothetical protein ABEJ78_05535 [Haloferacaceae archaeon]